MPRHDRHLIRVTVEKDAIVVDPETVEADTTDQIRWESTNGKKFRIHFENGVTCLDKIDLTHAEATEFRRPPESVKLDTYEYTVIADADPDLQVDPYIKIKSPTI